MLKIKNIRLLINPSDEKRDYDYFIKEAQKEINKKYHISTVDEIKIYNLSIDARHKDLYYNLDVLVKCNNEKRYHHKNIEKFIDDKDYLTLKNIKKKDYNRKVVVIGMGPSGLFNAYILARAGFDVTIVERGKKVEEREADIDNFFKTGNLNTESNVQFGEGGAGTYSDGKLSTGINSPYIRYILETFNKFGAPLDITYDANPHIGSDVLKDVIKNFRNELVSLGVNILFNTKLIDFDNEFAVIKKDNNISKIPYDKLVLAVGHSATDIYELLKKKQIDLEPKNFAGGIRIEHLQKDISKARYHGDYPNLPPANYKLVTHLDNGRSVYSFCMCPGGYVVNASSEEGHLVVNGMSNNLRDNVNANSALLVNIIVDDYYHGDILDGVYFQKDIEKKAYEIGGYRAPVQLVGDFLEGIPSTKVGKINPSIKSGYVLTKIDDIFPAFITDSLKEGITKFDQMIEGFSDHDAVIIAPETRSSSAIRIKRNDELMTSMPNVYAIGEGAGYAGGITSSAVDGIKIALKIIESEN